MSNCKKRKKETYLHVCFVIPDFLSNDVDVKQTPSVTQVLFSQISQWQTRPETRRKKSSMLVFGQGYVLFKIKQKLLSRGILTIKTREAQ